MKKIITLLLFSYCLSTTLIYSKTTLEIGTKSIKTSSNVNFSAGAAVIDMGISPQTVNNGLKPYGLVYELVKNGIAVNWIINPNKSFVDASNKVDQIDLSVSGKTTRTGAVSTGIKDLKTGSFLIAAEFIAVAGPIIEAWVTKYPGLTVYWQLDSITDAPVYGAITSFPTTVIYPADGNMTSTATTSIEDAFYIRAGIPQSSGAFRKGRPGDLTTCDQFYVLSHHTDPDVNWSQADVNNLYDFVVRGGNIWMGCHDVSISESLITSGKSNPKLNFLSTTGLMPYSVSKSTAIYTGTAPAHDNAFNDNNVDYTISSAPDPIMQFVGQIHSALNGNSERIYLPLLGGGWRSTTTIGFYARTQKDIQAGRSPGQAAIIAYGPAYGNPAYGTVLYQGSHIDNANGGTAAEWVGEARLFGNYLLESAVKTSKMTYAGIDQSSICGTNTFSLNANTLLTGSTGTWSIKSGPSGGGEVFSDTNSPNSTFYSPNSGAYSLRWSTVNTCASKGWDEVALASSNCSTLDFDGVDDYVNAGNNYAGSYSFEAWIRPKTTSGTILSKRDSYNSGAGYELAIENNIPIFRWNGGSVSSLYAISPNNRWYHIAVSFNGTQATMYVDGILMGTSSGTALTISASPFLIGASNSLGTGTITNNFSGWIDEVRIWNEVLTVDQVKFMMNQRLQNNANMGVEIPKPVPGNLLFNKLAGYYRLISAGSDQNNLEKFDNTLKPSNGCTPNLAAIGAPGRLHNMTTNQQNTAPLPYTSRVNGAWETDNTWTNYDVWDVPNSLGIDGTTKIDWGIVKTSHNIISNGNKTVLGLLVANNTLSANNDSKIEVSSYLKLDGKIDLVGKSQLLQTSESDLDVTSSGSIERDQQGQANLYNYNYWCSPVSPINTTANNTNYTIAGMLKDGTTSTPQNINWIGGYDGAPTSPISLARYWLYTFDNYANAYANWNQILETTPIRVGQGFTLKGSGTTSSTQNLTFTGKPNNGLITTNTVASDQLLLTGNPYPSALDATAFINDNSGSIDGNLYFWEHYTTNNTHILSGYQGGYAVLNLTGGAAIPTSSNVDYISKLGSPSRGIPNQYIPIGQGFFVNGKIGSGGTVIFKNSQRGFQKENEAGSNVMYKTIAGNKTPKPASDNGSDKKVNTNENLKKIRLGFNFQDTYRRQVLIGFMNEKATSGIDYGYDGYNMDESPNDMYLLNGKNQLVIEGEGFFDENSSYPIGVKTDTEGKLSFTIDDLENFDAEQTIFIYDNFTDTYHNIRNEKFEVNMPVGVNDNRFSLRFVDKSVKVADNKIKDIYISQFQNGNTLVINNNLLDATVEKVTLFNILGQSISSLKTENQEQQNIHVPIKSMESGVYIAKLKTSKGELSKKIIVH